MKVLFIVSILATIFAWAEPSEGFTALDRMMDSSDYDWPGSSRKPGLNRILIQSVCLHGFCSSIPTATFRRDSGTAEEQVAKPACRKMGNLPKCLCFSCAVYMPWKSELHAECICIWTAEVPFILVDSASDARGRGSTHEPINGGWMECPSAFAKSI